MPDSRPARVLHVIDGLAGGGSERWVYDIVRLSDTRVVQHRVVTVHPDLGRYVYADRLRALGALGATPGTRRGNNSAATALFVRASNPRRGRFLRPALRAAWLSFGVFPAAGYRLLREVSAFHPDVIHGHTFHGFVFAAMLSRLTGRPLVHTVPSLISQMNDAGYGWMPGMYRGLHKRVETFFTGYPEELERIGIPSKKVVGVRGGVDIKAADDAYAERARHRAEVRTALGVPASASVALSVGRLHASKGHDLAASGVALGSSRIPDLHWIVLGEGEERTSLEAKARDLGIAERSHFLGFVADVLPYYAASDVYLRTTLIEADNQSSFQAMALGLPVLGWDTGASTELLEAVGHGNLIPRIDSRLLADALFSILSSPDRGFGLGLRGRSYARAELGSDRAIRQFVDIYESLTARRRHTGGA